MFGSNPFGQTSTSPFGAQPAFGQTNNATSNPFAPKPFGSPSPFGSQSGSSIFGGMSTGVFGGQSSSGLGSTSVFGAQSSSAPAFGAASAFGQPKPSFGGFGSTTTTTPFGQPQSQPAFGSTPFGSSTSPFGAQSQPAFGQQSSSPAFGTPNAQPFGASSTPAFGTTPSPSFGSTGSGFGLSNSPFGSSAPAFNATPTPAFGAPTTSTFGTTNFGAPTTSGFGTTNFGVTSTPNFGSSPGTTNFNFASSSAFGQSTPASSFVNSPFGATTTQPFGAPQSTAFGVQSSTPSFGQTAFGGQRVGSRVTPYSSTPETDAGSGTTAAKLESISAMPAYIEKSHEELRWEDYQSGDKGGPNPAGQSAAPAGFGTPAGVGTSTSVFGQTAANPFSSTTAVNPFAPKTPAVNSSPFGSTTTSQFGSSPFGTSNPFGASSSSTTPSIFGNTTTQGFGVNTTPASPFNSAGTSGFGSPSLFGSSAQGTTSTFGSVTGFGNTQSPSLFPSSIPANASTSNPFGHNTSTFGQTSSGFGQTGSAINQSSTGFGQPNLFNTTPSTFGSMFSSSSTSLLGNTNLFGQTSSMQPAQTTGAFNFNNNFGQTQAAPTSVFGGTPSFFGQSTFGQVTTPQNNVVTQATPVTNPFGTLPTMPQMSIGRPGTSPSVQYGISSLSAVEKSVAPRVSSLLTSRHISQRRMRLPIRKYHPNTDSPRVAFFNGDEETQSAPKADAGFVRRENPRALVIRPLEQWPSRSSVEKTTSSKVNGTVHGNGTSEEPNHVSANEQVNLVNGHEKTNGFHDTRKDDSPVTLTGHRAGEAAIVYEHGADIEALMPKLRHSDYYTEPRIQEIAAKERAEPGYCRHVKDFVVGRKGYGSIKFFGDTDVRRLDLESLVQFNNREVIVYMDESKKPPVGQGLNKPAEVTLLNIKCVDKKSGQQCNEGPRVDKYKEMLKRKAEEQGAEFVSYDPVNGEWKFRVNHFSKYGFSDDDDEDETGGALYEDIC